MMNLRSTATSFHIGRTPKTRTTRLYFTTAAQLRIVADTNHTCLFILEYWLKNMGRPKYIIDDKKTAIALNKSVTTIRDCRLALQRANLFHTIRTSSKNNIHLEYCLGKEGVLTKTIFEKLFGRGCDTVAALKHKYNNIFGLATVLDGLDIPAKTKEDLYYLMDENYKGQFYCEEAA